METLKGRVEKINLKEYAKKALETLRGLKAVKNKIQVAKHILGLSRDSVIYRLKNGLTFKVPNRKKDRTAILSINDIFVDQAYNLPLNAGKSVIIDAGANIGAYSLYASQKNKDSLIYALEPDSDNFSQLKGNIKINNLKNIIPIKKALSNTHGQVSFFIDSISSRGHSLLWQTGKKVEVESITLQNLFKFLIIEKCAILKLDIEGAEYESLYNCPENIIRKIESIAVECHDLSNINKRFNKEGLKSFLMSKEFKIIAEDKSIILAVNSHKQSF